jgi:hypothetical protein
MAQEEGRPKLFRDLAQLPVQQLAQLATRHPVRRIAARLVVRHVFEWPLPMRALGRPQLGPQGDAVGGRVQRAGPILTAFAGWLADQRPRVLPKSSIGEAFTYATNQWPTLGVYLTDGRLTIDNAAAEQAIRPLAVGRRNWLHLGGDGGLKPTAALLSISASIKRQGLLSQKGGCRAPLRRRHGRGP